MFEELNECFFYDFGAKFEEKSPEKLDRVVVDLVDSILERES